MRLVVLGTPLKHSLSPAIHNAALKAAGIPGIYEALDVDEQGFDRAVADLRTGAIDGANVTMPHKVRALRSADRAGPEATKAGAANTLVATERGLEAHNTDVGGVSLAWRRAGLPNDRPVLVLGAGGAAAAAVLALREKEVFVAGRRSEAVDAMLQRLDVGAERISWGSPVPAAVVVNATPIGMHGESLPGRILEPATGLFDMAYGLEGTPAVAEAAARGIPFVTGEQMLLAQAEASFTLWTGVEPDPNAMAAGLRAEQDRRLRSG